MSAYQRHAAAVRDAHLRRVGRITRQVTLAGVALAGLFGAGFAAQLPGHTVHPAATPPAGAQPTPPAGTSSPAAPAAGRASAQPDQSASGNTQPAPAPVAPTTAQPAPAPTYAPPVTVSSGS